MIQANFTRICTESNKQNVAYITPNISSNKLNFSKWTVIIPWVPRILIFYRLLQNDSVLAIVGQIFSRTPKALAARPQEKTSGAERYDLPSPLNFDLSNRITFILSQSDRTSTTVTIWTVPLQVVFLLFLPCF